jgi:outer membrane protein OmpA-like peptidoglycan-associated protein
MNALQPLYRAFLPTLCLGLAACATTQDVEQQAARLGGRVDTLGATVQQLGESHQALSQQVRQLEASQGARIGKLDGDVRQLAQDYRNLGGKVDANHAEFIKSRLEGKLVKQVFLTEDRIMYPANASDIPPGDAKALDNLARELKNGDTAYHIEIQGHTEDSGHADFNQFLGEGRARAVRDYLHRHGGIPLYRMSTISYGATLPAADDPGAGANRRVKLLVFR